VQIVLLHLPACKVLPKSVDRVHQNKCTMIRIH